MKATQVRILILGALAVGWMLATPYEASAGLAVGGPLTVTVDDSPNGTNFTQTVTLGSSMTTLDQGEMTLAQTVVSTGPGVQWLVLDFQATGSLPLAGNPNGFWAIDANPALSSPSGFTGVFGYWTVNGAPSSPINSITSAGPGFLNSVGTDPLNPSISPVYAEEFGSAIVSGTTSLPLDLLFFDPYSDFITEGGMNPSAINGFVVGIQVTNSAVPEPSSLCLGAIGVVVACGAAVARHRRFARRA
jgi:hypothetical protein